MKHKIEIYVDRIFVDEGKEITDAQVIAGTILKHISHLGSFDIYVKPKPKTRWQKWLRFMRNG